MPAGGEFVRFRKEFPADGKSSLRFHISADERFVLLLDGEIVARGPDRGTPEMWFVQSYETLPVAGSHVMEAICWRMNPKQSPNAQLSIRGGFLFKADGIFDKELTTGVAGWKVAQLQGTRMTYDCFPTEPVGAQCEVFGTGLVDERPPLDAYETPVIVRDAIPSDEEIGNGQERQPGWMLYPSELPAQIERPCRPGAFKAADGQVSHGRYHLSAAKHPMMVEASTLLSGNGKLEIAANTKVRLLWDLGDYFCAYPDIVISGGKSARISWGWAESLYTGDCMDWHTLAEKERKGATSRAKWDGKYFYGITDVFCADGRDFARFTTPWWRCGRWCQIEVETEEEPLVIVDLRLVETRYPLVAKASFECDDESIGAIMQLCRRGLEMCMHETYMDCPYYEQQMYGGDTRLQMLIASALSGDDRLTRQSFRLFEMSQRDDGRVSMNYPTTWLQESTTYSLLWAMMLGDYALWHYDAAWVRSRMPAVRKLLFGMEEYIGEDGLVRNLPGWNFIDWVPQWEDGGRGVVALPNLLYLYALRSAAHAEESIGEVELAARWRRSADALARRISEAFWSEDRGMVADSDAKNSFSEHAQCLSILSDALPQEKAKRAFDGLVSASDIARCTVYFSHYLFETYFRFGRGELFLKRLDLWREFVSQDLKTPLEAPGDARSDCHAWGSHPLYHLLAGVAGIRPGSDGFKSVTIEPQPGGLKWIRASMPAPKGMVTVDMRFDGAEPSGTVTLPLGMSGTFHWKGKSFVLSAGRNEIFYQ